MTSSSDVPPSVRAQYERWPYPDIPLFAGVGPLQPWELHCDFIWDRAGSGPAPPKPRVWIAGCGTFQPYVFGVANPRASILATDISTASLARSRRRCAVHGVSNVTFAVCDLTDESTWPAGQFDLIECYGVLMNLPDAQAVLRSLGARLSPHGVVRIMLYPQFSRTRIFQLQRLARLCGFHAGCNDHPRRFRNVVMSLPDAQPLKWAMRSYHDSQNDAGIVDAFLHAGDRGFTGLELGALVDKADLEPAFWFHKPRAHPRIMAERLELHEQTQSFVLHHLDLWQELRTNFVVCLRKKNAPSPEASPLRPHPTFAVASSWRHALALTQLRLLGGRVRTRAGDEVIEMSAAQARALAAMNASGGNTGGNTGAGVMVGWEHLVAHGIFLGAAPARPTMPPHLDVEDNRLAVSPLRLGGRAPNPFYAHLFSAFEFASRFPHLGLGDLCTQAQRWESHARPLEQGPIPFGLTVKRTFDVNREAILSHLNDLPLHAVQSWDELAFDDDTEKCAMAHAWLRHHQAPRTDLTRAELRELWCLLFSHPFLFLRTVDAPPRS